LQGPHNQSVASSTSKKPAVGILRGSTVGIKEKDKNKGKPANNPNIAM